MGESRRRALRWISALLALVLVAGACRGDEGDDVADPEVPTTETTEADPGDLAEDTPRYGGRVVVGLEGETANWLPGGSQLATSGVSVSMAVFDPLMVQNADGQLEPNLAESLEPNDDLTEWTMTLRPDVQFHDGSDLTAEVIQWNFETLHAIETATTYGSVTSAGVIAVDVIDELTVVWRLDGPNAAFPDLLRTPVGWPVSREAYETLGRDGLADAPVGTGPFEFVEWRRDERFVVRRNENYWRTDTEGRQLPYLDEVEFRAITDEDSRVQSFAADTIQVVSTLRGSSIKAILDLGDEDFGGDLGVSNISGASIINVLVPPVDDVRIRRALAHASDAEAVAVVLGDDGLVPATSSFFNPDSGWFSSDAAATYLGVEPDVEAATALVEEYRADPNRSDGRAPGDPINITYACPPDPTLLEVSQLIQDLWGAIGIDVDLQTPEQAAHVGNAVGSADQDPPWSGNYMVNCWRAGVESDPLTTFLTFFGDPATSPGNFTNFSHPDIDEALDTLRTNADFETRYAAVERIEMIANEYVPIVWGVGTPSYVGWRSDIRGVADWRTGSGNLGSGTFEGRVILHQAWLAES